MRNREYRLCVHLFIHLNYSASSVAAVTKLKSTVRHVSCSLIDPGMWRVIDQLDDLATAAVSASHSCTVFSNENSLRLLVGRSVGRSVCDAGRRGVALMRSITARRQQQQQVGGADWHARCSSCSTLTFTFTFNNRCLQSSRLVIALLTRCSLIAYQLITDIIMSSTSTLAIGLLSLYVPYYIIHHGVHIWPGYCRHRLPHPQTTISCFNCLAVIALRCWRFHVKTRCFYTENDLHSMMDWFVRRHCSYYSIPIACILSLQFKICLRSWLKLSTYDYFQLFFQLVCIGFWASDQLISITLF